MHPIIIQLEQQYKLSDEDRAFIDQKFIRHDYPKQHRLVVEGSRCQYVYMIVSGLTRMYFLKDGRDVTTWFGTDGMAITVLDSLAHQRPSRFTVETMEPTQLMAVHYDDLLAHLDRSHTFERIVRLILLDNFLLMENRHFALQFHPAHERYANFQALFPKLINRIPLMHIASYLGITLETLSRIRANLTNVK